MIKITDIKIKIIMAGPPKSGKSPVMKNLVKQKFASDFQSLMGVDILAKELTLSNGEKVGLFIWDISEEEKFNLIRDRFYKGGSGAILVFDITRPETSDEIIKIHETMVKQSGRIPFMLMANKMELLENKQVSETLNSDCENWAKENGGFFITTRSDDLKKIDAGIIRLTNMIYDRWNKNK